MDDLKPCPFCGRDDIRYSSDGKMIGRSEGHVYWCGNCGAFGPNDVRQDHAKRMWNLRRPYELPLSALMK